MSLHPLWIRLAEDTPLPAEWRCTVAVHSRDSKTSLRFRLGDRKKATECFWIQALSLTAIYPNSLHVCVHTAHAFIVRNPVRFRLSTARAFQQRLNDWLSQDRAPSKRIRNEVLYLPQEEHYSGEASQIDFRDAVREVFWSSSGRERSRVFPFIRLVRIECGQAIAAARELRSAGRGYRL